ncbi:unnamed protein product [Euphydryas editha]|uniref:Uncharacterized protein n=1 Tax=Euphydryas editha TaxID=104508 RepID=A0AAU9TGV7_EUPED|nr:unnamed protein product [Euphydryas editha]
MKILSAVQIPRPHPMVQAERGLAGTQHCHRDTGTRAQHDIGSATRKGDRRVCLRARLVRHCRVAGSWGAAGGELRRVGCDASNGRSAPRDPLTPSRRSLGPHSRYVKSRRLEFDEEWM